MEDITAGLSELLSSADGMEKIKAAAESILGSAKKEPMPKENENNTESFSIPDGLLDNLGNLQSVMRILSLFQNKKEDKRTHLLLALKPHLSKERRHRVDRAVSFLQIADLLPLLKEEGLLSDLGLF